MKADEAAGAERAQVGRKGGKAVDCQPTLGPFLQSASRYEGLHWGLPLGRVGTLRHT